jgi:hypothetical protein
MKIALLVYEYPPKIVGGLGTYAAEITRKFVLLGHDVTVFTMNDDNGSLPTRELLRGIEIHRPVHIDVSPFCLKKASCRLNWGMPETPVIGSLNRW